MPGRRVTVKKTRSPVMNEFSKRLKRENLELWQLITRGDNPLEAVRKIASRVDFPRAIKEDELIAGVLNELWPYIARYESEEPSSS
ncbi:MAG: hypothetical protein ACYSSM_02660 [Planctomycetota bacterium]|jgi:hypothetical protein